MKKACELIPSSAPLIYDKPSRGFDYVITNQGEGKASVSWTGNGQTLYIGDLKLQLRHIIKQLDKAAEQWGVPDNMDAYGRARLKE